eukprot:Lankesteria_metandrocarpae@DN5294_c0_g1_i5.p2
MSRKRQIENSEKPQNCDARQSFLWPPTWWTSRDGPGVVDADLHTGSEKELWNALSTARRFLPSGVPAIDAMLSGGIPSGMVVEVTGAAGCGKSQFSMTLTARVLLPMITSYVEVLARKHNIDGIKRSDSSSHTAAKVLCSPDSVSEFSSILESCASPDEAGNGKLATFAVYYINTEGRFPHRRLKQITGCVVKQHLRHLLTTVLGVELEHSSIGELKSVLDDGNADRWSDLLMNFVFVELINSDTGLWEILNQKLATLSRCFEVEMIVIDSIAALFRVMSGDMQPDGDNAQSVLDGPAHKTNFAVRAVHLFRVSALLRRVASDTDCWIVCTNQVSSDFNSDPSAPPSARVKPALGLSWSNCVNCRLMLSRSAEQSAVVYEDGGHTHMTTTRILELQFAPHARCGSALFVIDEGGLAQCTTTTAMK